MNLRPPKGSGFSKTGLEDPVGEALAHEILGEKFATHGRLVEKLEKALAALDAAPGDAPERPECVSAASQALYHLVVQRDLMRMHGTERFLTEMGVPMALRAAIVPPRPSRRWRR